MLHPVEEEKHAEERQDVVVSRHYVFGAEINEGRQIDARDLLDVTLVAFSYGVSEGCSARELQRQEGE